MSSLKWFIIFASFTPPPLVDAAHILAILQFPYFSHQQLHYTLLRQLAERGHNLTIFTTHKFNYDGLPNVIQHHFNESETIQKRHVNLIGNKKENVKWHQKLLYHEQNAFFEAFHREIEHPEMQKIIHESEKHKFDLILSECVFCSLLFLADIYDCPVAFVSAVDAPLLIHGLLGNDISPSHYPDSLLLPFLHRHLTFSERIESLLLYVFFNSFFRHDYTVRSNQLAAEYFPHIKSDIVETLQRRSALLLANTNPAFGHVRPLMPNTVQIGFMHVKSPKPIRNEELLKFLDASKNGIAIVSFGSFVDSESLDQATVRKFMNTFNQTDFDVIWKTRANELEVPQNVLLLEWLPLADVLAHPNVKLIIFHAGMCTAYEAIDREVPMIVFPLAYDQGANARMLADNEIAIELDLNTFTEEELLIAIEEMTKQKYKTNVQQLRRRVYDQPLSAGDLAVWHVERVIKNKSNLRVTTSSYEDQYKRYFLDIIASATFLTALLWWLMKKTAGLFMSKSC